MTSINDFVWICVWQSTVCVLVGLGLSFALRRWPARAHRVLLLAIMAAAIVPSMSAGVRHFGWGLLAERPVVVEQEIEQATVAEPIGNYELAEPAPVEVFKVDAEPAATSIKAEVKIPWGEVFLWGWVTASVVLIGRVVVSMMFGVRLIKRGVRLECAEIEQALRIAERKVGTARSVLIYCSEKVRSPIIWCWRREPVLLLPSGAGREEAIDWMSVFCHELWHWKRWDHVSSLLAEVVVCVFPWNPLLWWAKRRLIGLSEQVCDDWVVSCGQGSADYANSLLGMACQGQMGFAQAVVSSKRGLGGRIRRILQDQCGNPHTGLRWALAITFVAVIFASVLAFAQSRPGEARPEKKVGGEEIWGSRLMDDSNILDGIMPVIKMAVEGRVGPRRPRIPRLHSEPGPGVLQGIIKDAGDKSEHMTALFFVPEEKWPGEPLFWYLAKVNESFESPGLPPGMYYLFSVETSNPGNIDDVGLPVDWPKPVEICADGTPAHVEIEILAFLSKKARFWNLQGFLKGVGHLNEANLEGEELGPYGKVTDSKGNPVPYATVQVREFQPSDAREGGIAAPDARTNKEGYYGVRPLDYSYFVGAMVYGNIKDVAGFRWQYIRRNKVFQGAQRIDFEFGSWLPEGVAGGTIEGSVVDANDNAIPSFIVDVTPSELWVSVDQTEEPWYKRWGLRAAFGAGRFRLTDVPGGECDVRIRGHRSSAESGMELSEKEITVTNGQTIVLKFSVEKENREKKRGGQRWVSSGSRVFAGTEAAAEPLPELKVGDKAPLFEVKTVDEKSWKLSDMRGKSVLLVFWVAGSQPSEDMLGYFRSVYESFGNDGRFTMLGLTGKKRDVKDLGQYFVMYNIRWKNAALAADYERDDLKKKYGIISWPAAILIGPEGKIVARNLKGEAIKWAVEKALKTEASTSN